MDDEFVIQNQIMCNMQSSIGDSKKAKAKDNKREQKKMLLARTNTGTLSEGYLIKWTHDPLRVVPLGSIQLVIEGLGVFQSWSFFFAPFFE